MDVTEEMLTKETSLAKGLAMLTRVQNSPHQDSIRLMNFMAKFQNEANRLINGTITTIKKEKRTHENEILKETLQKITSFASMRAFVMDMDDTTNATTNQYKTELQNAIAQLWANMNFSGIDIAFDYECRQMASQ
jgi:hypothetical protein